MVFFWGGKLRIEVSHNFFFSSPPNCLLQYVLSLFLLLTFVSLIIYGLFCHIINQLLVINKGLIQKEQLLFLTHILL